MAALRAEAATRFYGEEGWHRAKNWSSRWTDRTTMHRTANGYLHDNWDAVRADLSSKGEPEAVLDATSLDAPQPYMTAAYPIGGYGRRMDVSHLSEPLRRRMGELDAMPPMDVARKFVSIYLADADGIDEVWTSMTLIAATTTNGLRWYLGAIESVLADPPKEKDALAYLVGWRGNWVLDDPSDEGAAIFLAELADMLRTVIAEAETNQQ